MIGAQPGGGRPLRRQRPLGRLGRLCRAEQLTALLIGVALAVACAGPAEDPGSRLDELLGDELAETPSQGASTTLDPITADDVLELVTALSTDAMAGREAGTQGERAAAALIIAALEDLPHIVPAGDDGGWLQAFEIPQGVVSGGHDLGLAHNVLALLPGSDPEWAHETIVVGAHYDHVGKGTHGNSLRGVGLIHNGADDNASGTAVVLELARALATSPHRPRRSVLFQWYSGEELGLIGSQHWVAHPTRPLEHVVAMLNMDMVGRLFGSTLLVGGMDSSPVFHHLLDRSLEGLDLTVIRDGPGSAPSDNSSFYVAGIPVLFFFTGLHEDYHRPSDDVERVNARGAALIGRLAERMLRGLDGLDTRPPFSPAPGEAQMFKPRTFFGLTFDATEPWMLGGARVAVLIPDSPAGRAGLAEGDIVFKLDGERVLDRSQLVQALATTDDARSPRQFEVWRALPGEQPSEDDDWLDVYELHSIPVSPEVR